MVKLDNDVGMTKLNASKNAKESTKGESTSFKSVEKSPESTENPKCNNGEVKFLSSSDSNFSTSDAAVQISTMMRNSCAHTRSVSRPRTSTSYTKSNSLTDRKSLLPPKHMWVNRQNAAYKTRPDWNSNRNTVDESPREKLPRIRLKSQNKYDFLHKGKSVTELSKIPSNYERQVISWLPERSRKKSTNNIKVKKSNERIMKALKHMNFKEAYLKLKSGDTANPILKNGTLLFEVFSHHTDLITEERLYNFFLMFTPTGVAPFETYDFLNDSCDGKKELNFEDFLCYGDKLRERICAFEDFSLLNDKEKINTIAERISNGTIPAKSNEVQCLLLKVVEEQQSGRMNSEFKPMRAYELSFLDDLKKRNNQPNFMRTASQRSNTAKGYIYLSDFGSNGRFDTSKRNVPLNSRRSSILAENKDNGCNNKKRRNSSKYDSLLLYDFSALPENNDNESNSKKEYEPILKNESRSSTNFGKSEFQNGSHDIITNETNTSNTNNGLSLSDHAEL